MKRNRLQLEHRYGWGVDIIILSRSHNMQQNRLRQTHNAIVSSSASSTTGQWRTLSPSSFINTWSHGPWKFQLRINIQIDTRSWWYHHMIRHVLKVNDHRWDYTYKSLILKIRDRPSTKIQYLLMEIIKLIALFRWKNHYVQLSVQLKRGR